MKRIPDSEFRDRVAKVQQRMQEDGLDLLFVYGDEFHQAYVRYLTDYWPVFAAAALVVPSTGEVRILGDPEGELYANESCRLGQFRNIQQFIIEGEEYPRAKFSSFKEVFDECAQGKKMSRMGMIRFEDMPVSIYNMARDAVPGVELVDAAYIIDQMRVKKSPAERDMLREAYRIADLGAEAIMPAIKPGITERELVSEAEYVMRKAGAEWFSFSTIIGSGERINTVLARATNRVLKAGELLQFTVGAKWEGYGSAIGRTTVVGTNPTPQQKAYLQVGYQAETLAIEQLKLGVDGRQVDKAARQHIEQHNLGDYHLYSVGHGIGIMECGEEPCLTPHRELIVEPGHAISIDIGIFGDPGFGGQRFEDGFIATEEGIEPLSHFRRETF